MEPNENLLYETPCSCFLCDWEGIALDATRGEPLKNGSQLFCPDCEAPVLGMYIKDFLEIRNGLKT